MSEMIVSNEHGDAPRCICGNDTMDTGFTPADPATGQEVEPYIDGPWNGSTIKCMSCSRLINQTLIPNPDTTSEWDTHLMKVIAGPRS
jgi:hypothetical protein